MSMIISHVYIHSINVAVNQKQEAHDLIANLSKKQTWAELSY